MNILSIITFILAFESSRKAHFIFRSILDFLHIICFYLFKQKISIYLVKRIIQLKEEELMYLSFEGK
jgi:hypothetical protein